MDKIIRIECRGSGAMPLDDFVNFQGNLKTLSKEKFEAGRMSILKYGFSSTVSIWANHKEILDGHQRLFIVRHLVEKEGYRLAGDIPYDEIFAETRKEAAEKLLAVANSHYGQITDEGLYEYLNENQIDIAEMVADGLDLPDIDMDAFLGGDDKVQPTKKEKKLTGSEDLQYQVLIFCSGEHEQAEIMQDLEGKGIKCKPLIL